MAIPFPESPSSEPKPAMSIEQATLVEILPTSIWVESDWMGAKHIMIQHQGLEACTYATLYYDYRYTSNSMIWDAAKSIARQLGATDPIEERHRPMVWPTVEELKAQISALHQALAREEARAASSK